MSVQQLPHGVIKLISSTQVISSVSSVVKELVENAIDAGAGIIDIKLEKTGLEKIEIRDNGCGIAKADADNVCLPNYTSKIYSFDDLEKLESYGFRGEALNSLCAVSQLQITTKTDAEDVACTYTYDNNGTVREVQPSHYMKGTIVSVTNLFKNVPVRRQYYENTRQATAELKRTEKIVKLLSVIHPKLRVTIAHNKCLIWQKTAVFSLRQSLMQVYPHVVLKNLVEFKSTFDSMTVEMLICKRDCNWSVLCQPLSEAILFFVNKRPVRDKKVEKVVLEEMTHLFASSLPHNKCPLTLIALTLSPQNLDVNVEPDKSKIFMKNHEEVLKQIRESIMLHFYEQPVNGESQRSENNNDQEMGVKRKIADSSVDVVLPKRILYDDIPSIRALTRLPSNISTRNDENLEPLRDELLDLDASQFEEDSTNEFFSKKKLSSEIPENVEFSQLENDMLHSVNGNAECQMENNMLDSINGNAECQVEQNMLDSVESSENQQIQPFDISFESHSEKVEVEPASENGIAHNSVGCNDDLSLLNTNESLENEFEFNLLPEDSTQDQKKDVSRINDNKSSTSGTILNQTTLSQWSKGLVRVEGNIVEGGAVIATALNARLTKRSDEDVQKSEKRLKSNGTNIFSPLSMERSVSSQMGRKDLAGLTNFARTIRSEIVKENPGISFTKVAGELANRWRNLRDDEKKVFSERSKAEKNQKLNATNSTSTPLVRKTYINSMDWSVDAIKSRLQKLNSTRSQECTFVIGPLRKESEWVCRVGHHLVAVQIHQLKKNVFVHRDLCHISVRSQVLDVPLPIDASIIGADLWDVLISLEKSHTDEFDRFFISDPRILKNGFKIVLEEEFPEKFKAVITETSTECRSFVVETLVETLKLIQLYEDLKDCRPAVIKRYISAKFSQSPTNESEIQELLTYWVQQMSQISVCPADIPASVKIYSFSKENRVS